MSVNQTIKKFGYPATLLREFDRWVVLLRPKQVTLGSVVLACKEEATALPQMTETAFNELRMVSGEMEATIKKLYNFDRINYLILMMVDPEVHFHVIPRYSGARNFGGVEFTDPGWPRHPNMLHEHSLTSAVFDLLRDEIRSNWVSV